MRRHPIAVLALLGALALAACGTHSSSGDPNVTPGDCVLKAGVWYCGAPYGNIPQCPSNPAITSALAGEPGGPCDYDGGCFDCDYGTAGAVCDCRRAPDGGSEAGNVWWCLPSETGCGP